MVIISYPYIPLSSYSQYMRPQGVETGLAVLKPHASD